MKMLEQAVLHTNNFTGENSRNLPHPESAGVIVHT